MDIKVYKLGADFCANCKTLTKVLEGKDYEEVDVTKEQEMACKYAVRNLPTTLFFKGDELMDRKVGLFTAQEFDETVDKILNS
jgi:thioredoxin 1